MSAAELARAAKTLRERVEAATPGPWERDAYVGVFAPAEQQYAVLADADHCQWGTDLDYVATMHPGVGAVLVLWLEHCAGRAEVTSQARLEEDAEEVEWYAPSLQIARLINGMTEGDIYYDEHDPSL